VTFNLYCDHGQRGKLVLWYYRFLSRQHPLSRHVHGYI
jgi:hypothetical protein